jgi:GGDEF domain-containing protein
LHTYSYAGIEARASRWDSGACSVACSAAIPSEGIANGFAGVDRSYAIQAGREIRVIVQPEKITDAAATIMAQEIRKKIEAQSITVRRQTHNVTVSIGVSTYPKDGIHEEELVKVADERLYKAKSEGRNKTCAE